MINVQSHLKGDGMWISRKNFGKNIWTNFGKGRQTKAKKNINKGGHTLFRFCLMGPRLEEIIGRAPLSPDVNGRPVGPKPDPVNPAEFVSVFDKETLYWVLVL